MAPAGTYDVTFPTGQYSLPAISSYLVTALSNNLHPVNLFSVGGQDATGLAYVTFLTNGDSIHFEQAGTIGSILGFPSAVVTATSAGQTVFATTQAQLDRVNTYLISGTLIQAGIPTNASANGLLAAIPITGKPGRIINYAAINVLWTPAPELVGRRMDKFTFRLTNERFEPTPTAGDTWSFTLMIRYRK